jgi:hypothetical protein
MSFHYYIKSDLIIGYKDTMGRKCEIHTDMKIDKVYIHQNEDENYDKNDTNMKYNLKNELEKNTYNTIIFENDNWVNKIYQKIYEKKISREFKEIKQLIKIYKKVTAMEMT